LLVLKLTFIALRTLEPVLAPPLSAVAASTLTVQCGQVTATPPLLNADKREAGLR
jgi:hypothetical protein